jgi:hypothetical protein
MRSKSAWIICAACSNAEAVKAPSPKKGWGQCFIVQEVAQYHPHETESLIDAQLDAITKR